MGEQYREPSGSCATSAKTTELPNRHLHLLEADFLYHLEIPLNDPKIVSTFQNVRFVCVGGTSNRMESLAIHLARELGIQISEDSPLDFSFRSERYSGFKVGPVFCVSHGIGMSSLSVMIHEVFKLLQAARCCDVTLIRVGTCGGIGVSIGSVVISTGALTAGFEPVYNTSSLGRSLKLPAVADDNVVKDIFNCRRDDDAFLVVKGRTYCTDDFYQGQGRLDGSFCDYSKSDKDDFLQRLQEHGVVNIEMESAAVLAMALKVGVKAAVVCSVIIDRLKGDLPTLTKEEFATAQTNAITLVSRYIKHQLSN